MPKLVLSVDKPLDIETKLRIASSLTHLTKEYLNKKPELTAVIINDDISNWYINGKSNDTETVSYDLSIQVTLNSNSDDEKKSWLTKTKELLHNELGIDHSLPNYITILDVDGKSWGYNGVSQFERVNKEN